VKGVKPCQVIYIDSQVQRRVNVRHMKYRLVTNYGNQKNTLLYPRSVYRDGVSSFLWNVFTHL